MIRFVGLDAPEVDRIADAQFVCGTSSAPQPDSADEQVEATAQRPEIIRVEPAPPATEFCEHGEHGARRRGRVTLAAVNEQLARAAQGAS